MKQKKIVGLVFFFAMSFCLFAFNPSVEGENLYLLGSPDTLANGNSVSGGALPSSTAINIAINPALTAAEQRVIVDVSLTSLISGGDNRCGFAGHVGAVIPSKYGVFTGSIYGISSNLIGLDLGNNFTLRAGFAKDVTEKLFVGADFSFTFGSAWGANIGLGFTYDIGKVNWLPFLKDVRWGASLTGLGYGYKPKSTSTIYEGNVTAFPSIITPRIGISGSFIKAEKLTAGLSLDLSLPTFQNAVFSPGLQVLFNNIVRIKMGSDFNLRELVTGKASIIPSVSVSVKFGINTKEDSFLAKQGWQQSEIVPAVAYRYLNNNIQAASVGITAHLGLKDTESPEIKLW